LAAKVSKLVEKSAAQVFRQSSKIPKTEHLANISFESLEHPVNVAGKTKAG
jgi:hypothetical protein